jgi:hypothetical protein
MKNRLQGYPITEGSERYKAQPIEQMIMTIRGQRVILDADLARIYGVPTKRLNEQVRRNADRFPPDFAFVLTEEEVTNLKSQIATSSTSLNRSQFATASQRHRDPRFPPYAFTEHGALMVANILRSKRAVDMSVFVVRAFIRLRGMVSTHRELSRRLVELEKRLESHDEQIQVILKAIKQLMAPPEKPTKRIGFQLREKRASYSARG